MKYILSLDQGTTGSTAILFDEEGGLVNKAYREFTQIYPQPGWVEHDPEEVWQVSLLVMKEALADVDPANVKAIGITNQRETVIMWDKMTGKPVHNAIVWQCRRTAGICKKLKEHGWEKPIKQKTGLPVDPYFSATKIWWILESMKHGPHNMDQVLVGTVDSWLVWKLTGGKSHVTDYSNASRTMLFNINTQEWDEELLKIFKIPKRILPEVKNSSEIYGETTCFGPSIPIAGIAGDQQAALFGQRCFTKGESKCTYGTGSFLLMNTGQEVIQDDKGLISTIAWGLDGQITYALEGSIFIAGAAIQWLRDGLGLLENATQSEHMARSVKDNGGVYFVPAFNGLGTPHWDADARGLIVGLSRGTKREHIVRAALEAIAYQTYDIVNVMQESVGFEINTLKVDGGASQNNWLMQFQADILDLKMQRSSFVETTARGAAFLAGLAVGLWSKGDLVEMNFIVKEFASEMTVEKRQELLIQWSKAVKRSQRWV